MHVLLDKVVIMNAFVDFKEKRDKAGCFKCGITMPLKLVRDKGVGFGGVFIKGSAKCNGK